MCVIYLCLAMFGKNISRFLLAAFAHFTELKRAVWIRFCVLGELTNTIVALPIVH